MLTCRDLPCGGLACGSGVRRVSGQRLFQVGQQIFDVLNAD